MKTYQTILKLLSLTAMVVLSTSTSYAQSLCRSAFYIAPSAEQVDAVIHNLAALKINLDEARIHGTSTLQGLFLKNYLAKKAETLAHLKWTEEELKEVISKKIQLLQKRNEVAKKTEAVSREIKPMQWKRSRKVPRDFANTKYVSADKQLVFVEGTDLQAGFMLDLKSKTRLEFPKLGATRLELAEKTDTLLINYVGKKSSWQRLDLQSRTFIDIKIPLKNFMPSFENLERILNPDHSKMPLYAVEGDTFKFQYVSTLDGKTLSSGELLLPLETFGNHHVLKEDKFVFMGKDGIFIYDVTTNTQKFIKTNFSAMMARLTPDEKFAITLDNDVLWKINLDSESVISHQVPPFSDLKGIFRDEVWISKHSEEASNPASDRVSLDTLEELPTTFLNGHFSFTGKYKELDGGEILIVAKDMGEEPHGTGIFDQRDPEVPVVNFEKVFPETTDLVSFHFSEDGKRMIIFTESKLSHLKSTTRKIEIWEKK